MVDPTSPETYQTLGGFDALRKAVTMDKPAIIEEITTAQLRGRGGASYPAGRKWAHFFQNTETPKYIVCNADEGEPGTFKDKVLLEQDPLSVIEGMLIASYVFGVEEGFIYLRGEYRPIQGILQTAMEKAEAAGFLGKDILGISGFNFRISVFSGAGAYVCGENSALLNSLEGKTGRPRVKPPHLADYGLYQKPTLVNNVETFACIPPIIALGGQDFLELGTPTSGGTKLICISGHAKNRGIFEVPLGASLIDILYDNDFGGGTESGRPIGFCHLGGQSGPLAFPEQFDVKYDYDELKAHGLALGTGAIVVLDDQVDVVEYVQEVVRFFVDESCGKCTPCRLGTTRLYEQLGRIAKGITGPDDIERLEMLITHITELSACGLGQASGVAVTSALKQRKDAFASQMRKVG